MHRSLLIVAALLWASGVAPASSAPIRIFGGLSFTCDVNTTKCRCEGDWEGADCQAMKKNCKGDIYDICLESPEQYCTCTMASVRAPIRNFTPISPPTSLSDGGGGDDGGGGGGPSP